MRPYAYPYMWNIRRDISTPSATVVIGKENGYIVAKKWNDQWGRWSRIAKDPELHNVLNVVGQALDIPIEDWYTAGDTNKPAKIVFMSDSYTINGNIQLPHGIHIDGGGSIFKITYDGVIFEINKQFYDVAESNPDNPDALTPYYGQYGFSIENAIFHTDYFNPLMNTVLFKVYSVRRPTFKNLIIVDVYKGIYLYGNCYHPLIEYVSFSRVPEAIEFYGFGEGYGVNDSKITNCSFCPGDHVGVNTVPDSYVLYANEYNAHPCVSNIIIEAYHNGFIWYGHRGFKVNNVEFESLHNTAFLINTSDPSGSVHLSNVKVRSSAQALNVTAPSVFITNSSLRSDQGDVGTSAAYISADEAHLTNVQITAGAKNNIVLEFNKASGRLYIDNSRIEAYTWDITDPVKAIVIHSNPLVFVSNSYIKASGSTPSDWYGIYDNDAQMGWTEITNCVFEGKSNTAGAGIYTTSTSDRMIVTNCHFIHFATGINSSLKKSIYTNNIFNDVSTKYSIDETSSYCDEHLYTTLPTDTTVFTNRPIHVYDSDGSITGVADSYWIFIWDGSAWRKVQLS